jgi:hypothetical protein
LSSLISKESIMKLRYVTLTASVVLGVITYVTYLQLQHPEDSTQGSGVVSVSPSPVAAQIDRGEATNGAQLAALQEEVASLRAEFLALQHQLTRQAESVHSGTESQPAPDMHDPGVRAEAARERHAEIEAVDAAFRKQAIDPTWSANTASTIREVLNSEEVGEMQANNIDCRSDSCRVELHDDGSGRLGKSLPIFALQMAGQIPSITADTIAQADGSSTIVLYMSRDSDGQGGMRSVR